MFKKQFLQNPRWRTAAILKNVKCNISAAVWPILMKFGVMMHLSPHNLMGNKNFKISKSKMADGSHYENRKISIFQKLFGRFWWKFTWWNILVLQSLPADQKIKLLKIQDGGRPPFWKLVDAISQQPFDWFWWDLVWQCILGLPIWRLTKNFKISKSKMADGGHLENKNLWYLQNHLVDFAEILYDHTY